MPKSLFALSKTFFDKSKVRGRRFQNSPFRLKQLQSPIFRWIYPERRRAKIYKQPFNNRSKEFLFGQQPVKGWKECFSQKYIGVGDKIEGKSIKVECSIYSLYNNWFPFRNTIRQWVFTNPEMRNYSCRVSYNRKLRA